MEEKKFSPEQPDEVIELFDIVEPIIPDESPVQAEQEEASADGMEESLNAPEEESLLLEPGEEVSSPEEGSAVSADAADSEELSAAEAPMPSASEDEGAQEQGLSEEGGSVEDGLPAVDAEGAEACPEAERPENLKARIAALEKANRELAENVESLSQQLAQVGTMFLEDASVRLWMEEMVSRMLDARLPSSSEPEMSSEEASGLVSRVEDMERRLKDMQAGSEQMAAAAAARVIREEIAAMKAESAGLSSR